MAFKIDPSCPIGLELVRCIRELLASAIKLTSNTRVSASERIHVARTTCKKARAALKLGRSLDQTFYRRENRWLRDAADRFSDLRDASVITENFANLGKECASATERKRFDKIRRALAAHRRKITPSPAEFETQMKQYISSLRVADKRLAHWSPQDDFDAILTGFGRTYKRARCALSAAESTRTGTAFHEWRKAANAHAYQCRLLRRVWPSTMRTLGRELKKLTGCQGDEHDLTILAQTLQQLRRTAELTVDKKTFGAARTLIKNRRRKLRKASVVLGTCVFADRPRVVQKRLAIWWRVAKRGAG